MNRRSFFRFLAVAPFAAPAAIVAARAGSTSGFRGFSLSPEDLSFLETSGPLKPGDFAQMMKRSRLLLDEAPTLCAYIDDRLRAGI